MVEVYRPLIERDDSRFTEAEVQGYLDRGEWVDRRLDELLWDAEEARPDHPAIVSHDVLGGTRTELTYREFGDLTRRLAAGMVELGVGADDVVSVMLPNRAEFAAAIFAIFRLGAVYSGIPTAYGRREVDFMLRKTGARVLVVPSEFRNRDYVAFAAELLEDGIGLDHVVVVGHDGALPDEPEGLWRRFDDLVSGADASVLPSPENAARLAHIGFTSGTTGEPKGVMNTHQTLFAVLRRWVEHVGTDVIGPDSVNLVPSPIGHHTGFLWGVLLSSHVQGTGVLMDRWDGERGAEIIHRERPTMMVGAVAFLQDLLNLQDPPEDAWSSLRVISIPGAPIPRGLVPQARDGLDCFICPAWGMTEYGIGISGAPDLPRDRVEATDGVPVDGCRVRVVDDERHEVPRGTEGDLQIGGAGLFMGYLDRPEFTEEAISGGWFDTGDRAVHYEDDFVALVGRSKDIIIRGGENIPVAAVETLLYSHPAILDAAVVAMSDPRLGERACACIVVRDGHTPPELPDLVAHLLEQGLSKHFLPERMEILDELPRTMSGKIRKVELRDWLDRKLSSEP